MTPLTRRVTSGAIAASAVFAGLLAVPQAANAATYGSCGSGYSKIRSYPLEADFKADAGSIDVYYSASTGKNCAIARPISALAGKARDIWVCIERPPWGGKVCDGRTTNYRYFAGPVHVYARGSCISLSGGMTRPDGVAFYGGAERVHCG